MVLDSCAPSIASKKSIHLPRTARRELIRGSCIRCGAEAKVWGLFQCSELPTSVTDHGLVGSEGDPQSHGRLDDMYLLGCPNK